MELRPPQHGVVAIEKGPFGSPSTKVINFILLYFISQKTISMTFSTDYCTRNFLFTGESVSLHSMDCLFDSGS